MQTPTDSGDTSALDKRDERYYRLFADALEKSSAYRPALGQGSHGGLTLDDFQALYRADPFYSWIGLDSPLMYAAHRAAGGMTSVYRQIGIGCERIFRAVLQDQLGLTLDETRWTYEIPLPDGKTRRLSLDGRIELDRVHAPEAQQRVRAWFDAASASLLIDSALRSTLRGAVFEVRQGYKSMDSKRQNADISNASNAYLHRYMPVLFVLSMQIDRALVDRYTRERWLILTGARQGPATLSAYAFCRETLDYDLAAFFEHNSTRLRALVERVLSSLLRA